METGDRRGHAFALQAFPPFLVAGLGMVAAGLLLGKVTRDYEAFRNVQEIIVLVPALMGLKGNLEMTLASRLSTHANHGRLDCSLSDVFRENQVASILSGNIIVIQFQAILVGLMCSIFAIAANSLRHGFWNGDHAVFLVTSAVTTASVASLFLAMIMIVVVLAARRCGVDPDNIASPIADLFGDFCTLGLLSLIAESLWYYRAEDGYVESLLLTFYCMLGPVSAYFSFRNEHVRSVLEQGLPPVITSMILSSLSGIILHYGVERFHSVELFSPVMNGSGGCLAAVYSSRLSTKIQTNSNVQIEPSLLELATPSTAASSCDEDEQHRPGNLAKENAKGLEGAADVDMPASIIGMILVLFALPGSVCFSSLIVGLASGWTAHPTVLFGCLFALASITLASFLVLLASGLVPLLWKLGVDPDTSAIPYLTAVGDIVGTCLLIVAFWSLQELGGQVWLPSNTS
eukprot:TRINITY_DN19093_c0_g1_i1.p1 TRINITY_DN19093_c0_g1~~TRINITY_DN19093_c0_g1_i1.p1  ORF type:complete len:460 (-),score=62.11 TRINITY_DN19093_c0_g1_i1:259-1638(-)